MAAWWVILVAAAGQLAAVAAVWPLPVPQGAPPAAPSSSVCAAVNRRLDCGYSGITPDMCQSRGCCYDTSQSNAARRALLQHRLHNTLAWAQLDAMEKDAPSCFYPGNGVDIKTVHVVQSNHFDAGYAALTTDILNEYFDIYFPRAATVAQQLRARGGPEQLRWLTQSYVVSLYLDCPPASGLHCPNASAIAQFEQAVRSGGIYWQAFPHDGELDLMDPTSITFGVKLTHDLDDRFNVSRKTVYSQRDVPGMARASIPILVAAGVKGVSEGSNGPNAPPAFVWHDPVSGQELIGLWHAYDYGELPSVSGGSPARDYVVVPNFDQALIYAWRGDNEGPPMNVDEVVSNWAEIQSIFPDAQVISSSLDEYVSLLEAHKDVLPVISQDLTDTWLMGGMQDPVKAQQARAMNRAASACLASGTCTYQDPAFYNFSRLAIKNGEHTFGLHASSYGPFEDIDYANSLFHRDVALQNNSNYEVLAYSWVEQRNYGIRWANEAVAGTAFATLLEAELQALQPQIPDVTRDTPLNLQAPIVPHFGGWLTLALDPRSGALTSLLNERTGHAFSSSQQPLGWLRYQTLTDLDFAEQLRAEYLRAGTGGEDEYGKPNCSQAQGCQSLLVNASLTGAWVNANQTRLTVQVDFEAALHANYGAPSRAYLVYTSTAVGVVNVTVVLVNKTSTRYPEAIYLTFDPLNNDRANGSSIWVMDKLGAPLDVVDVAQGGGRGLQAISSGVTYYGPQGALDIESLDVPLVRWGTPYPFPTPLTGYPDLREGASFILMANPWNTNYAFWYPFRGAAESPDAIHSTLQYRFALVLHA